MKQVNIPWTITEQNVVVSFDGQTHIVKRSEALADRLIEAVKAGRIDEIPTLVSKAKQVEVYSDGTFTVRDGRVLVNGVPAPEVLSNKILRFSDEGLPYEPLVRFAEKLQQNPSYRSVNELFRFLEKNDMPLFSDGSFLAYKAVREDFKDVHSGKFDNSPGMVHEMPRNQVDEDCAQHCSHGFHVGNWRYCHEFHPGGHMLEVKVNPADVVSVPNDLDEKIRVCKYEVIGVVNAELSSPIRYMDNEEPLPSPSLNVQHMPDDTESEDCCVECGEELNCCGECDSCDEDTCFDCGEHDCVCVDVYPWRDELDGF